MPDAHGQRYTESAVLKKVLETAIAPDLLKQLQAETNFTPATSEAQMDRIEHLLQTIYSMAEEKGSEHPDTLNKCQELVDMYEETCQFSCAEKLLLRLQIAFQRTYGRDNIMMSKVWNRLAEILMHEVHYPEAETYYLKSLALIEIYYPLPAKLPHHRHASHRFSQQFHLSSTAVPADDKPDHASSRPSSARTNGQTILPFAAESKSSAKQPETKQEEKRNRDLESFASLLNDLTSKDAKDGDMKSEQYSPDIIEDDKKTNNDEIINEDPIEALYKIYIPVLTGLADIYWHLQRLSDSERCYRRVLPMLFYLHGLQHIASLSAVNGLALVLEADGRAQEALELCEKSLQDCITLLGPKHPITQTAVSTVARLKETLGLFQEAEAMYRLAIAYSSDALGETHTQTLNLQCMLSRLLQRTKQYAASLIVLETLAPQYEALYGVFHLEYLDVLFMQGELCIYLDDFQTARGYFKKCYENRCLLLRTRHHPLVYQAKFALGKTYHMACNWRHDIALFRTNLAMAKELLTHAFYGTVAIYGHAPIHKPLVLLPTVGDTADTKMDTEADIGQTSGDVAGTSLLSSSVSVSPPSPSKHHSAIRSSMRTSLGLESLVEAESDGSNVDVYHQQQGVLRAECIEMALYLGRFYLEFEFVREADLLYRLLFDVIRQQQSDVDTTRRSRSQRDIQDPNSQQSSTTTFARLFTKEVQAEIHVSYGHVLEAKRQYARAVTTLETAGRLYKDVLQDNESAIRRLEEEIRNIRDTLLTVDAQQAKTQPTPTSAAENRKEPLAITMKRMMLSSKEDILQQLQDKQQRLQQTWEDCQEQHAYAMSLYNLST